MKKKVYGLAFFTLTIDQIVKILIRLNFTLFESTDVIPHFLYLTYAKNTGGAWSIFDSLPYLLVIINILFLILMNFYIYKKSDFSLFETIYLGLILGGVSGNLIDRIVNGGVIDYIGLRFGNYNYPIFNFADIAIVFGMALIAIEILGGKNDSRDRRKRHQN